MKNNEFIGSSFDDFLMKEDTLAKTESVALKRIISYELLKAMEANFITKTEMAKRMHTSRSSLTRLLDPNYPNITLETIEKAAVALGKRLEIHFH
jgi:antitoxin HicB